MLTWDVGDLQPGETGTITVVARARTTLTEPTATVHNVTTITSATDDPNPDNNRDDHPTTILTPDIAVEKAMPARIVAGVPFTATITVRNLGPAATVDLTVEASGRDLGRLLSQGGAAAPAQAQQPFQVAGTLKGDAGKIAVDLTARLADGQAKVAGTVEPARAPQGVALTVDVSHPSTGRLMAQLSPGYRAQGGDIAALERTFGPARSQVLAASSRDILAAGPEPHRLVGRLQRSIEQLRDWVAT